MRNEGLSYLGGKMGREKVTRISISLPPDLLESFDEMTKKAGYRERSRAVQKAMRNFISEQEWVEGEGAGSGVIQMIYDHHVRGLEHTLTDIQHKFRGIVASTLHVHLNEENCLLAIVVRGDAAQIRDMSRRFTKLRGVKQLRISFFKGD